MNSLPIPYLEILKLAQASGESMSNLLRQELLMYWRDAYLQMSSRPVEIIVFTYGTFDYVYDAYQQPEPYNPDIRMIPVEARLIAAIGVSSPKRSRRDDGRLRGMTVSAMPGTMGPWDRGHFIAHSIGGTVDGNEANVFQQLRSVNRGRYRRMENFCFKNPGVTCFSRPIYVDVSAHPDQVEFGILKPDGELWVEVIPNRQEV